MNYSIIKKFGTGIFAMSVMLLGVASCIDENGEEFVVPTGNINNIQPNTLFTNATDATDALSLVFRSFSTDAVSYSWDFGDGEGTSTEANPNYTYTAGGLYNVKLTTISSDGLSATDSTLVSPIFVDFNTTSTDTEVAFENLSTGVSSLVWDFGDGETAEWDFEDEQDDPDFSPTHIYTTDEILTATLTATNFLNEEVSIEKSIEGLVLSTVPDFTFVATGFTVDFTDSSILAVSHSWDFGDGNTSTDVNPIHTYLSEGTFDVTLTTTNDVGVSRSITKAVPIGGIQATFAAVVLNGSFDEFTSNTGDNADAWDMTPNSTVEDNSGATVDSPYRPLWNNGDLNTYIDNTYCTNEQPSTTSDGSYVDGVKTRGGKFSNNCRRLYQVVAVEPGVEYTFSIDTRSEVQGVNTEIFILNTEITTEASIDASTSDPAIDAYFNITNDFNSSKGSATDNTFTTTTLTFQASSDSIVIYVRALNAVDGSNEVFLDNVAIATPGFAPDGQPTGVTASFAAEVLNGSFDEFTVETGDNADAWDMTPNSTVKLDSDGGAESDSPYRALWNNSDLNTYIDNTFCTNEQPSTTSDGSYVNGVKTRGGKFSNSCRRLYQLVAVEPGVQYTFSIDTRSELEGVNTEIFILNTEITTEAGIDASTSDTAVDAYFNITNDFNSSKGSATDNTFTTTTLTFTASNNFIVIYARALNAIDGSSEVFIDNVAITTPGF